MKLNNEGHILLKFTNELSKLIKKIITKHKPDTPMEFALLNQQVLSIINFDFSIAELENRCKKMKQPKEAGE